MTMFGFRKGFGQVRTNTGVPGGYRTPPGSVMGLLGLSGEEEGRPGQAAPHPPPPIVQIGQGGGGAHLSFPLSPTPTLGRVPSEFGQIPKYRGVTGTPRGV